MKLKILNKLNLFMKMMVEKKKQEKKFFFLLLLLLFLDGQTNFIRAAEANAKLLADRNRSTNYHLIEDTQNDTLIIPDTMMNIEREENDNSWQRDIDRLMRKLQQRSSPRKLPTQIQQTQIEKEIVEQMNFSQTKTNSKNQFESTRIIQTNEIGIQTENLSSIDNCCHDISICPCVIVNFIEILFIKILFSFFFFILFSAIQ